MTESVKLEFPVDGSICAERPVATDSQVDAVVGRARTAQVESAKTQIATRGVLRSIVRAAIRIPRTMRPERVADPFVG